MNEKSKNSNYEYGIFVAVGLIVAATGIDLTGRLMHFLYGEWPYICAGLVIVAFFGTNVYVHSEFNTSLWNFQNDIEKKLALYEEKISNLKLENRIIRDEIAFMRRSAEESWRICEKTIEKANKVLEQKSPVVIEAPSVLQEPIEQNVQDAIHEVVGGVI